MPSAVARSGQGLLGFLSGLTDALQKINAQNRAEGRADLQAGVAGGGFRRVPVAPEDRQPTNFLSQLFGQDFRPTAEGQPVIGTRGGGAVTLEPVKTFADLSPDQASTFGLTPDVLQLLSGTPVSSPTGVALLRSGIEQRATQREQENIREQFTLPPAETQAVAPTTTDATLKRLNVRRQRIQNLIDKNLPATTKAQQKAVDNLQQERDNLTKRIDRLTPKERDFGDQLESIASTQFNTNFDSLEQTQKELVRQQANVENLRRASERAGKRPIPESVATKFVAADGSVALANEIFTLGSGAFTGPIAGRAGTMKEFFGRTTGREIQFRRAVFDLKDFIARIRSGAAIGVKELKGIERFIPTINDTPKVFRNKLIGLQRTLVRSRNTIVKVAAASRGNLGAIATKSAFDTKIDIGKLELKDASSSVSDDKVSVGPTSFSFRNKTIPADEITEDMVDSMTTEEFKRFLIFEKGLSK